MHNFVSFWGRIVTAINPFPCDDENAPLMGLHLCHRPNDALQDTKEELAKLLNWVEQHKICRSGYCQVKHKVPGHDQPQLFCRFNFSMNPSEDPNVGLDSKQHPWFEPKQNDPLLNSFNVSMILAWQTNINVKPVLSKDAAIKSVLYLVVDHFLTANSFLVAPPF